MVFIFVNRHYIKVNEHKKYMELWYSWILLMLYIKQQERKEEILQIPFFTISLKKKDKQSLKCIYLLNSNEKTNETVKF